MQTLDIKFYRSIPGDIPSYGEEFNQQLDQLVGGAERWDTTGSHGVAAIAGTDVRVQRFETGPEIFSLVVTQLSNYIPLLAGLIGKWLKPRKIAASEQRVVKLAVGDRVYEGPISGEEELKRIIAVLSAA